MRGDLTPPPVEVPHELIVLGLAAGAFWVLLGVVFFVVWFARRRRQGTPEARAHAEHEHREHLAWVDELRTTPGRHRTDG